MSNKYIHIKAGQKHHIKPSDITSKCPSVYFGVQKYFRKF